jgi:hypothetical protein
MSGYEGRIRVRHLVGGQRKHRRRWRIHRDELDCWLEDGTTTREDDLIENVTCFAKSDLPVPA